MPETDAPLRAEQFRRTALLYFLPLVILNFIAGARVMTHTPGLIAGEHLIAYVFAGILVLVSVLLLRDVRRTMFASYMVCGCVLVFFIYRQFSLLWGPSSLDETRTVFLPLYGYYAIVYFSLFVFLPGRVAERCAWAFFVITALTVSLRIFPDWANFAQRRGTGDLLIYILVANPMFIMLARLMVRMQQLLFEAETELAGSRREVELLQQVADREARFDRAVSASQNGLWEWREDGQEKLWFSEHVQDLLGQSAERLPTTLNGFLSLAREGYRADLIRAFETAIGQLASIEVECPMRRGDGAYHWFSLKGVARQEETGWLYLAGSMQSIHARRMAEGKLQRSHEAMHAFASIAAHDLSAPIRKIRNYVAMIESVLPEETPERATERLQRIARTAANMQALVERLLDYAVADRPAEISRVSLDEVLSEVMGVLEFEIQDRGAQVDVAALPEVYANAGDLAQVFQNLIGNALKFCEGVPRIQVSAVEDGDFAAITVQDNGIGIPRDQLQRIREPLQRLHGVSEYQGHGLGLATVDRIIERNHGSLRIESTPGEGSRFTVRLPRQEAGVD